MRIDAIHLQNFQTHRNLRIAVPPESNVVLLCGDNGVGKSTVLEAIRFALADEMPRAIDRKSDISDAILTGEKEGNVTVAVTENGPKTYKRSVKTGNYGTSSPPRLSTSERAAMIPRDFLSGDSVYRRKLLFAMAGIEVKIDTVTKDLIEDGFDATRIAKVSPKLNTGFDATAKEAERLATEARGAWKQITGENYGDVKGENWAATVPELPEESPESLSQRIAKLRESKDNSTKKLANLEADQRQFDSTQTLRESSKNIPELDAAAVAAKTKHDQAKQALQIAQANVFTDGWTAGCPCCGAVLESIKPGELRQYQKKEVSADETKQKAIKAEAELGEAFKALVTAEKALSAARAAKDALASLPQVEPDPEQIAQIKQDIGGFNTELLALEEELRQVEQVIRARDLAATHTAQAAQRHADVQGFSKLAKAIEQLPVRYLDKAVSDFNTALQELTPVFGQPVQIGPDLEPTYGLYRYAKCSKSQQWRIELAIGYVLASRTHGLCLIDDFDVLSPKSRIPVIKWMMAQGKVQFFVAATMKQKPELPEQALVRWLGVE